MTSTRQTQIINRQTIADTFVHLQRRIDEVTLQFEDSPVRHPLAVVSVDRAVGQCLLEITGLDDVDAALARTCGFVLHIRQLAGTMTTSPMRSTATAPSHADGLRVRCTLPEALTLSRHRNDFRAVLARPLKVDVCLRSADATEYNGRLCNLSVGGGLMRVPQENAGELKTCRVACRLRMRFPSGDVLDADCRVRRAYRPSESRFIYVAFVFAADVIDQNRRGVWFYVREIEREVTRLTRACNNMRALAPSPLFADSPNTAPRPRPVAAAQSG